MSKHGTLRGSWDSILLAESPSVHLRSWEQQGVLRETFPEIQAIVGFGGRGHKDLWDHTLKVVNQTPCDLGLRWAALWHDVGKVQAFSRETGKVSFHGHEILSAKLFCRAMKRTKIVEGDLFDRVHFIVRNLGLVEGYSSEWTDSAVRRIHRELGDRFDDVLAMSKADVTTKYDHKRARIHSLMEELRGRALAIAEQDAVVPPLPKGLGTAIMGAFGLPPGRQIGQMIDRLKRHVEVGDIPPHKDADFYVAFLRSFGV